MNREVKREISYKFTRHKVSKSSAGINASLDSISKGTEASSREIKVKEPIWNEFKPNSPINSINIISVHRQYEDSHFDQQTSENKNIKTISKLNEELKIMTHQLELAYDQINDLTFQINEINLKHSIQVQKINEKNQKKMNEVKNDPKLVILYTELRQKNELLQRIVVEKDKEIQEQQRKFNDNLVYLTEQYEKKLKFKENEHLFKVENFKSQFVDVIQEIETKFLCAMGELHRKNKEIIDFGNEGLKEFRDQEEALDKEGNSEGLEENSCVYKGVSGDLNIIEELSLDRNYSLEKMEESVEGDNEFDEGLRKLISDISFEGEVSDIIYKEN